MDYHVGSSPSPDNTSQDGNNNNNNNNIHHAAMQANMFDMASFDLPQNNILDQLTASAGLTFQDYPMSQAIQQQQQQYYIDPSQQQQQQHYGTTASFAQPAPATAALNTMGHQQQPTTSVVSMESASNSNASIHHQQHQQQQQQQYIMPTPHLQALAPQAVPSTAAGIAPGYPPTTALFPTNLAPSVVSMSTAATTNTNTNTTTALNNDLDEQEHLFQKRPKHWNNMTSAEQRRWERNMREQLRSHRISAQIKQLRTVLFESNVPFKPNKYSILQSVAEYIQQLQARAIMLDAEHSKLIDTIRQTSEMVNSQSTSSMEDDAISFHNHNKQDEPLGATNVTMTTTNDADSDLLFVQGIDYKIAFEQCTAPMGIAALDGRILAVNDEFQSVLGYSRQELLQHSLFTILQNHEQVYRAMGEMLKAEDDCIDRNLVAGGSTKQQEEPPMAYWSGIVGQTQNHKLCASITLTRSDDGTPKFFNCALMVT